MRRTAAQKINVDEDDLRSEYHFDYRKARPNPYAVRARTAGMVVLLDDDITRVFRTPDSVKTALRALIAAMPFQSVAKQTHRSAKA
jgi:hypothetical protein